MSVSQTNSRSTSPTNSKSSSRQSYFAVPSKDDDHDLDDLILGVAGSGPSLSNTTNSSIPSSSHVSNTTDFLSSNSHDDNDHRHPTLSLSTSSQSQAVSRLTTSTVATNRSTATHQSIHTNTSSHGTTNQQHQHQSAISPIRLRASNSFDDWDVDDDEETEDEAGLRRYHLDFSNFTSPTHEALDTTSPHPTSSSTGPATTLSMNRQRASSSGEYRYGMYESALPPEIANLGVGNLRIGTVWHSFCDLRKQARQRRAARLLSVPSESFGYQCQHCLVTVCCDATDAGIVLVAVSIVVWILLGWMLALPASWWWMGLSLFVIRVTARRAFERIVTLKRTHRSGIRGGGGSGRYKAQRHAVSTETVELGSAHGHEHDPEDDTEEDDDVEVHSAEEWHHNDAGSQTQSMQIV